jgi:hypothetical protein
MESINGSEYYGGSTDTIAFKTVSELLKNNLGLSAIHTKKLSKGDHANG